jgi:DNA-binding transcriptional ArsR family regulator
MMNLDHTFSALADPTRRAILARLALGEATVGELCAPFDISGPAISRHLKVLEQAALITRERDGQHRRCRLAPAAMGPAAEWIETTRRVWYGSVDKLD